MKVGKSLAAMRNTNKGYIYVDRFDRMHYRSDIEKTSVLIVGDSFAVSDISYGKIDKGTDTQSVINAVEPNEYKVDFEEYEERNVSSELPVKVEPIAFKTEVAQWWYDQASIDAYGERKETFDVVHGTGNIEDIRTKELGPGFHDWADAIMEEHVLAKNRVSKVMIIPNDFYDLERLSALEIFDPITILYKNESHKCYIRKMEWTVHDNHVRLELFFSRGDSGGVWVPDYELTDIVSDIAMKTFS